MILNKFTDFYKRFEKWISPVGLIYGFIFTSLTLTRVDMFLENFWIVVHLLLASFGILAVTYYEKRAGERNAPEEERVKFHFFLTLLIQFAFGGLFSTFFVFYMRSTSLSDSWLFLAILLILLVGNELWKKHYQRLAFQVSILFISLFLFFVFLLPVLFHRLGADLFIYSGLISLFIVFIFTRLIKRLTEAKFHHSHRAMQVSIISIFVLMNILYFTNIIPPIPLALKQTGVYHLITKTAPGTYQAMGEPSVWQDYFTRYPVFHKRVAESIYVFSAIFSPVNFATTVIHQWQYYDEIKKQWVDYSRVTLPISGGREEGFRTYSIGQPISTGLWRVKVMIPSGQVLGNINFKVEISTTTFPDIITKIL